MNTKGVATKRQDVYRQNRVEVDRLRKRKERLSSTFAKGSQTNFWGEFVGHGDVARGLDHFNQNRLAGEEIK
jgi:hypothetical protein